MKELRLVGLIAAIALVQGGLGVCFSHRFLSRLAPRLLHVNALGSQPGDNRVDHTVLDLAVDCGGTISGEHGIGQAKIDWLTEAGGATSVSAMRSVRHALDPTGLLNPRQSARS